MEVAALVSMEGVGLVEGGRTLSWELLAGDRYAVMGPGGAGKSRLLSLVAGEGRPVRGEVTVRGRVSSPLDGDYGRRATPFSVGKEAGKRSGSEKLVTVLDALALTDVRETPVAKLSPTQAVACDLLACFVDSSEVVVIDGHLDVLDPWILERVFGLIEAESAGGRAFLISTHRPDVAERLGGLIVMRGQEARFAGTVRGLVAQVRPAELTVELEDESSVRTMVEPFTVGVKASPGRLELTSHAGQALAARLLTHGYGSVRSVVVREATLAEALAALF